MTSTVIASRITEAREARAMSMEDLAENIGVTRQSVSKYEKGIVNPSPEILQAISYALSFPTEFFYKTEQKTLAGSSPLFFRSNSNIAKKVKNACKYQIKWTDEIKKQLERYVDFVERDIPTLDKEYEDLTLEDIEELALTIRKAWGLSDDPIDDLIGVLENKGVIVTQFATSDFCTFKGIDAFSCWKDGTPYILDWAHATQGNASADAARTYLIFWLNGDIEGAKKYLDLFCKKSETAKQYVQKWMPIVAASQSVKGNAKEREFLLSWVDVVDYE